MLNVYDFYSNPKSLTGYKDRIKYVPDLAYEKAIKTPNRRSPELEPTIMKNTSAAYWYAADVIKGRWPDAEPIIMKDPSNAYQYALKIIKGRWPEAEPYIMKDPEYAAKYKEFIKSVG